MVLEVSTRWIAYGKVGRDALGITKRPEVSHDAAQRGRPSTGTLLCNYPHLRVRQPLR